MNSREEAKSKNNSSYKNPYLAMGSKKKKAPAKKAPASKKPPIRDPQLVDDVDARLAELAITDWAEATGFVPHRTKEENLKRFLDLSDDEIFAKVEAWRNKAA